VNSTKSGSTARLLELCGGYFLSYVATGVLVKFFTQLRTPRLSELAYLVNNTAASSVVCVGAVVALGWLHLRSNGPAKLGPFTVPVELLYIVPSGVCTAIIIPATTLLYLLPISVMVAMVIMRGCVIVVSRVVDAVQIRQGILRKQVYAEENWAVVFALLAVATNVLLAPVLGWVGFGNGHGLAGSFDFLGSAPAMTILTLYLIAYGARIYIMNYFKNTRAPGVPLDNRGFFAIEQISASATMLAAAVLLAFAPVVLGSTAAPVVEFARAARSPDPWALLSGVPYAFVAFFSVFIFMYQGRTATFAGLVNRLTSLLAGTTSTLLLAWWFHLKPPGVADWVSFAFIFVAVAFLSRAEQRRVAELRAVASAAAVPAVATAARA
jgi:hypothetical protein